MSEIRKAILHTATKLLGFEDERTIFLHQLAEDYEDNDWNNKCMSTMLCAMLEMKN